MGCSAESSLFLCATCVNLLMDLGGSPKIHPPYIGKTAAHMGGLSLLIKTLEFGPKL